MMMILPAEGRWCWWWTSKRWWWTWWWWWWWTHKWWWWTWWWWWWRTCKCTWWGEGGGAWCKTVSGSEGTLPFPPWGTFQLKWLAPRSNYHHHPHGNHQKHHHLPARSHHEDHWREMAKWRLRRDGTQSCFHCIGRRPGYNPFFAKKSDELTFTGCFDVTDSWIEGRVS